MRKFLVVAFCLLMSSSLVLAVPAGPGGTIYVGNLGSPDYGGPTLNFYYVDVDSNWDPITPGGAAGAAVFIATVNNVSGYASSNDYWGNPNIWTPGTGYHTAELMTGAYYNNNSNSTKSWGSEGNEAADILKIQTNGTITILNDGVYGGYNQANMTDMRNTTVVDNAFIPAVLAPGDPNRSFISDGQYTAVAWVDSEPDGLYDDVAKKQNPDSEGDPGLYSYDQEYVPGFGLVTSSYSAIKLTTWNGTKYISTVVENDDAISHSYPISARGTIAVADVDNDGVLDYYYIDQSYKLIHAEDWDSDNNLNGAGDAYVIYDEDTEALDGQMAVGDNGDLELVKCPDGSYALLVQAGTSGWYEGRWLKVFGLDSAGDWDTTSPKIIITKGAYEPQGTPYNDSTWFSSAQMIEFDALPSEVVPEPATMLLVGTGVLGLVGVVRRRMLK